MRWAVTYSCPGVRYVQFSGEATWRTLVQNCNEMWPVASLSVPLFLCTVTAQAYVCSMGFSRSIRGLLSSNENQLCFPEAGTPLATLLGNRLGTGC